MSIAIGIVDHIAIGIVAHSARVERAHALFDAVKADYCNVDDGTLGCAGNHLKVLGELAGYDTGWSVVLEDDAEPVSAFRVEIAQAVRHTPAPVIGLYLGTGNPSGQVQRQMRAALMTAQRRNLAWITADCLIGSVGYAIRTSLIEAMLPELVETLGAAEQRYARVEYPLAVSRWAQNWEMPICYTVPSLVDHADDTPIGYGPDEARSERRAWSCGTRQNWATAATPLGYCNGWSKPDG